MEFLNIPLLGYLLALFFGLGCGSYATMPAHRLPRGEAAGGRWVGPRSKCPSCGTKLRTRDLVPVFNWLLTRGKCQHCGTKVSLNYLFIEASCTVASLFLFWRFGFSDQYTLLMGLAVCIVILLSTDWHHKMFPRQVLWAIVIFGVAYRVLKDHELFGMLNCFAGAALVAFAWHGYKKKVARLDYLFFIAIAGLWLDELQLLYYFLLAGGFYLVFKGTENSARLRLSYGACLLLPLFILLTTMGF